MQERRGVDPVTRLYRRYVTALITVAALSLAGGTYAYFAKVASAPAKLDSIESKLECPPKDPPNTVIPLARPPLCMAILNLQEAIIQGRETDSMLAHRLDAMDDKLLTFSVEHREIRQAIPLILQRAEALGRREERAK